MNEMRRRELSKVADRLDAAWADIESLKREEDGFLGRMPEAFVDGAPGERSKSAIRDMELSMFFLASAINLLRKMHPSERGQR